MNPYTYKKRQLPAKKSLSRQTFALIGEAFNQPLSLLLALAMVVFASGSVGAITLVAYSEISGESFYSHAVPMKKPVGKVLGSQAYGYMQPLCQNQGCLGYGFTEYNSSSDAWKVRLDYTLPQGTTGLIRLNGKTLLQSKNISGNGSLYTDFQIKTDEIYNFILYKRVTSTTIRRLVTISVTGANRPMTNQPSNTTSVPPAPAVCDYPEARTGCHWDFTNANQTTKCGAVLVCTNNPPPSYGYYTPAVLTPGNVSTCGEIKNPGTYNLTQDLNAEPGQSCITIHDTKDVILDCNNKNIVTDTSKSRTLDASPVSIKNSNGFTIKNCNLKTINNSRGAFGRPFTSINSQNGVLTDNYYGETYVSINKSSNLVFKNSHFDSALETSESQNITVSNNSFKSPTGYYDAAGLILSSRDTGDVFENNDMNGMWDGNLNTRSGSADDGVVITRGSNIKVLNNTIYNIWDCGIENTQFVENITIANNKIKNAGVCGIGGWYGNSWKNSTISGNIVDSSPLLFNFQRVDRLYENEQVVYFKDNVFINNKLTNPKVSSGSYGAYIEFNFFSNLASGPEVTASKVVAGNNFFQNNDFNTQTNAPFLSPSSMFVDGGGNICGPLFNQTSLPIKCASNGQQAALDPNTELTRAQVAQKLYDKFQIGDWKPVSASAAFTDVDAYSPAFAAVNALYANGITNGCSYINTIRKFCPADKINRWQFSAFLIKSAKINTEDVPKEPYFKDVPASHPGFAFVQKMRQLGITNGCKINYDTSGVEVSREFCPDMSITEYQAGVLMNNAYNVKPK